MKASDVLVKILEEAGVKHAFELIGGMTTHMLDSIGQSSIKIVSMHHEQGAAFAVDGYGRMADVPAIALATSGPGATNLLTGMGSCFFDSVPAVFITGQVNSFELRKDRQIRQLGFQETDIVSMAKPITKGAYLVEDAKHLEKVLHDALKLCKEGRPGPVLIDITMDAQRADIPYSPKTSTRPSPEVSFGYELNQILSDLEAAKAPLILVGGGIRSGRVAKQLREFVELARVPLIHSLMGVDALPSTSMYRLGMIGSYGNRWSNLAVGDADYILVLGSRLDIRQTGADVKSWQGQRKIVHVDCESAEINNRVKGCDQIVATLEDFFAALLPLARQFAFKNKHRLWLEKLNSLRTQWPDIKESVPEAGKVNPNALMHMLAKATQDCAAYVVDVGQHQMWAAQSIDLAEHQRFLTSGGMGAMGFALPAAIGAAVAAQTSVVVIAGDGGFQLNIQELQAIARMKLPVKVVILNNNCHGMVRQFQESYFDSRYYGTYWGYSAPSFKTVAEAYGIEARAVANEADAEAAVRDWFGPHPGPCLLEVAVDTLLNVYPKIAFGRPMTDMEPHAKPIDMEGT